MVADAGRLAHGELRRVVALLTALAMVGTPAVAAQPAFPVLGAEVNPIVAGREFQRYGIPTTDQGFRGVSGLPVELTPSEVVRELVFRYSARLEYDISSFPQMKRRPPLLRCW